MSNRKKILGIQGGKGSFNEAAAHHLLKKSPHIGFELVYLHTTEKVLGSLQAGNVELGLFALKNSVGGLVEESRRAMAQFVYSVVEEFTLPIHHSLMMSNHGVFNLLDTVMTHPQILAQCRTTLQTNYPQLRPLSGEGDLIDQAYVAELIGNGSLTPNIATLGSKALAAHYGLRILGPDLQDSPANATTFLLVKKPT